MNRISKILFGVVLCALANGARANLEWEQTQIELHPKPGDATAVGSFKYKNTGNGVVHIKSLHTSCGCTTAALKKNEVAPGEAGEITATFNIGSSTGVQQKTVRVETDDSAQAVTILSLRAVIPQLVELKPSFIFWENSEPASAKTIVVKTAKELNAKTLNVNSSSPDFTTRVASTGRGEFKIEVTPRDTSHALNAVLTIQPDNGAKPVYATARVVNPKT